MRSDSRSGRLRPIPCPRFFGQHSVLPQIPGAISPRSDFEREGARLGCWMFDVGCSMLDVRCWMFDVGCSTLDVRRWMFDVGCWMLDVRRVPRSRGPLVLWSPISYLLSPIFFFKVCADSHSFCDAIHSEDTNLFRIMKKP